MIDWHSKRFKKVAVWIMAGLLVLFLVGSWQLREMFDLGRNSQGEPNIEVTLNGDKVDMHEYQSFRQRWNTALKGETLGMRMYGPESFVYAMYFSNVFPYMPITGYMDDEGEFVKGREFGTLLDSYLDNFYCRFKEAEKMGFVISDERINDEVKKNPLFQSEDPDTKVSPFSEVNYAKSLDLWRITESAYRDFLRERLMIERLERMYLGFDYVGNAGVSPLEMAEKLIEKEEQRKVRYVKVGMESFRLDALAEVEKRIKDNLFTVDDEVLEAFYKEAGNFDAYATPRKVKGDCLYIDMAKLTEGIVIDRDEIEKKIREDAEKNLTPSHYEDFYRKHKDRLYLKTPGPNPPVKPAPNFATPPQEAGPPVTPESAVSENGERYMPYFEIKERIKKDIIQHRINEAFEEKWDEKAEVRLNDLYDELEEQIKAFHRVNTPEAAKEIFRDVSMGNVLGKLADFFKASMAGARRREGVADLKAFADRHDCVEYMEEGDFFSEENAEDVWKIGGADLARIPVERYVDFSEYTFDETGKGYDANASVYKNGLSGILKPADGKDRFIFRLLDVRERELLEYADLGETAPDIKEKIRDDYIAGEVHKSAYKFLYDHQEYLKGAVKKDFDFDFEAKVMADERKKYLESQKKKNGGNSGFGIEMTEYFTRDAGNIEGIVESDMDGFVETAFDLNPHEGNPALAHEIPETAPGSVSEEYEYFYIITLADEEDKPVRHPAREDYREKLDELFFMYSRKVPVIEDIDELSELEKTLLQWFRTTAYVQELLQKRFDNIAATFSKVVEEGEEDGP